MTHLWNKQRMLELVLLLLCLIVAKTCAKYEYQIKYLDVPLDHFNYVNETVTFKLRYLTNDTYNPDGDGPILFYTGNEGDIELFAQNTGFMWELAPKFKASLVFAEHRYYGKTLPFGNASYDSPANLGYLTSEQALADFASLLTEINPSNRTTRGRPVIAFGGSYGGMLAAWFRMKYPHLVTGAIAASAPIRQFDAGCGVFNQILTSVFTVAYTRECSQNIERSWDALKNYSSTADGLRVLQEKFKFCTNVTKADDITETFFDYLGDVYGNLAMINYPYNTSFLAPVPAYPVREFCGRLAENYTGLELISRLQEAVSIYSNYTGKTKCLDISSSYDSSMGDKGWEFQTCTEMMMPMCSEGTGKDMFPKKPWDEKKFSDDCFKKFGVRPKSNVAFTMYGGLYLDGVSNIVFSNGLMDPWSGGGVLRSGNRNILVVLIPEGAHHIDLRAANENDPGSVLAARQIHVKNIQQWLKQYRRAKYY
ncbi:lysosomal Pro-X carboxypeptidase [Malaya genurostris]|uniref:lysosomal Pro-X carboxypeptidase n=1 Tax=Malaya genurostris TaxID=325434 RepID=UPI0026F3898E|nr:lysosomal Pro-X carboxypeptidase [Malaya genurostris]XP_058444593.1 lysosomal Pro-X carboxypeptidase [Malaya genurostris]